VENSNTHNEVIDILFNENIIKILDKKPKSKWYGQTGSTGPTGPTGQIWSGSQGMYGT